MPGGRPSLYRDEYVTQVRRLALLGLTDEEMASFFEVLEAHSPTSGMRRTLSF